MNGSLLGAAVLLGLGVIPAQEANAQPAPAAQAPAREAIECGAGESKRKSCQADVSTGVVLVNQEGDASCVLGQTWGFDAQGVWVANGCRGTFAFTDDRPTVSCAAAAGARQVCEADIAKGVALVSGSPACVQGKTWGYDEDGLWVADGCTATFVLTSRGALTCGADPGGRRHCDANTSAGVVLARSTGTASCVLGESWGYDSTGVWTDRGCQGDFVLGETEPAEAQERDLDAFFGRFEPYGRLLAQVAAFKDGLEVQDNASWLGLKFSTRGPVKFFAATEWGVNLVQGGEQFSAGATTNTGFLSINAEQNNQVFGARLGYVGVDLGAAGRIAIGKQWGVHTDVTMYTTDQFNVFGSEASATYTADSDGGFLGTGRADQTVSYHNSLLEILDVGGQLQFRSARNSNAIDGAGVSAQLTVLPGARIGAAYTKAYFGDDGSAGVRGLDGDAEIVAVGARVDWNVIEAGLVYAHQRNGDLARVLLPGSLLDTPEVEAIVFDAHGVELFARVNFPGFALIGGLNDYRPDVVDPLLHPDFRVRYGILGAELQLASSAYLYAEARLFDDSVGPQGQKGFNVLAVGLHYGFSFKGFHRQ